MTKTTSRLIVAAITLAAAAAATAYKWDDLVVKPTMRAAVEASMKDPSSVLYRNEVIAHDARVCGELNAKNGYGAYVGFKRFISEEHRFAIEGDDVDSWRVGEASTAEVMDAMQLRIEVLQAANKMMAASGVRMSQSEVDAQVKAVAFQRLWDSKCK